MGYARLTVRDRGPYPTADGHLCCMIYTDEQWRAFLRLVGRDGALESDPRLTDIAARTRHADAAFALICEETRRRSTADWLAALRQAGLTGVAMRSIEDLLEDPHLAAAGFFQEASHPQEGRLRLMRPPGDWSTPLPGLRYPPPDLGEHTEEVLGAL
jgi:crotonobetainyl-CoA:carnitine CoA-transferase CaiB-like acyl-CoA transferase